MFFIPIVCTVVLILSLVNACFHAYNQGECMASTTKTCREERHIIGIVISVITAGLGFTLIWYYFVNIYPIMTGR